MPPLPVARIALFCNVTETINLTVGEAVTWYRMPAGGAEPEHKERTLSAGPNHVDVTPGVYGFVTFQQSSISNPDPGQISVVTAAGKDSWPDPPDAPSLGGYGADFKQRFGKFLRGLPIPGGAPDTAIVLTIVPSKPLDKKAGHA